MTWPLARLGSRFSLLFEPHYRRVMHSGLGRFYDEPLELSVGLVEPDGTERVMPLTPHGDLLYACEQFDRINSLTFRGYSESAGLRLELNFHAPFYPQSDKVCILPIFFVEMRLTPAKVRWRSQPYDRPERVRLFFRMSRPKTNITAESRTINLSYDVPLQSGTRTEDDDQVDSEPHEINGRTHAHVEERLYSLNPDAVPDETEHGCGLTLEMPVTEEGSGLKWRLVWAAHTPDHVLDVRGAAGQLRYQQYWDDIDSVMAYAIEQRDDFLGHSRRFEKLLEQATLRRSQWHLLALGFQSFLSNTIWCNLDDGREWFSVTDGTRGYHASVDVQYNASLLYLNIWPRLLKLLLGQWADRAKAHEASGGAILDHDAGRGLTVGESAYPHDMPVEVNADYLLMLQAYAHWTGDLSLIHEHVEFIRRLAAYLLWTDQDGSGFPSNGTANTIDDGPPALQFAPKQTYLAIKRVTALQAAADLLRRAGDDATAERCRDTAAAAVPRIEKAAWLGDHYAVCLERDATGLTDVWTGRPLPPGKLAGWDDYSIYTANGLLLPALVGQPTGFDSALLQEDLANAQRETLSRYGCAHCSSDDFNVRVSQNLWRDHAARFVEAPLSHEEGRVWDLQVFSNSGTESFAFIDTYIGNELGFCARGAATFGYFLAGPRLVLDRLDGECTFVNPDRYRHQRWPLLPLADWAAGKIPICVVNYDGTVTIEGELEDVTLRGEPHDPDVIA
ncbi:MAG: hypothetical protein CMJ49_08390 [Planctomycetaceae bacterium]|nr:hypothetical protein [Planctomycetaceae bacterium]